MPNRARMFALLLGAAGLLGLLAASGAIPLNACSKVELPQTELCQGPEENQVVAYQPPKSAKEEEDAIRKASDSYSAAINKGDVDALMTHFAANAEFINVQGLLTKGKAAIAALFKTGVENLKGHKFQCKIESLRFIKADVAIEDGTIRITNPKGQSETSRYTAIWVKQDGKWLISSARDLPTESEPSKDLGLQRLKELEWLVGDWVVADKASDVQLACKWAPNHSFLLMDFAIKDRDGEELGVSVRIGYDPSLGQIRSWVFDTNGGITEGYWFRDGNTWNVDTFGVTADGRRGSALARFKYVDENNFVYNSTRRELDGQPVADAEVKLTRKK